MPRGAGQKDQALPTGRRIYGDDGAFGWPMLANTTEYSSTAAVQSVRTRPVKTVETELLATQSVAASANVVSGVLTLTGMKSVSVFIDHGRASSAAFGDNGTKYRIEGSQQASGNDTWRALTTVTCASTACLSVAASADVAAGGGTITVTSGTSIPTRDDLCFWANTVSAGSSEWMRVISASGTASFTILDTLRYAQDSDTNIFTQAEHYALALDVSSLTRLRAVVNNNASGTTLAVYSRVAVISET